MNVACHTVAGTRQHAGNPQVVLMEVLLGRGTDSRSNLHETPFHVSSGGTTLRSQKSMVYHGLNPGVAHARREPFIYKLIS